MMRSRGKVYPIKYVVVYKGIYETSEKNSSVFNFFSKFSPHTQLELTRPSDIILCANEVLRKLKPQLFF